MSPPRRPAVARPTSRLPVQQCQQGGPADQLDRRACHPAVGQGPGPASVHEEPASMPALANGVYEVADVAGRHGRTVPLDLHCPGARKAARHDDASGYSAVAGVRAVAKHDVARSLDRAQHDLLEDQRIGRAQVGERACFDSVAFEGREFRKDAPRCRDAAPVLGQVG